jgi:hypothetical protein
MQTEPVKNICRNCGSELSGRFCSSCGQKYTDVHDRSIKTFFKHFFNEFFNWDSKFFSSFKYVLLKPGHLTNEYINGRMASYITPLKLYLCVSLVFFFLNNIIYPDQYSVLTEDQGSGNVFEQWTGSIVEMKGITEDSFKNSFNSQLNDKLPIYMLLMVIMFSLPLKLVDSKKYYVEHLTFSLHFFTFVLFCMLIDSVLSYAADWSTVLLVFMLPCAYLLAAFKKVYRQNWIITIFETGIFSAYYLTLLLSLIILAVLVSSLMA